MPQFIRDRWALTCALSWTNFEASTCSIKRTLGRTLRKLPKGDGETKTRFLAKLKEIGRFGGQMEIILASLKGELHTGPFLGEFWANKDFLHEYDKLLWPKQKKTLQVTFANTRKCPESGCQRVIQDWCRRKQSEKWCKEELTRTAFANAYSDVSARLSSAQQQHQH